MISRRHLIASTALAAWFSGPSSLGAAATKTGGASTPWRNWSGHLLAHPKERIVPGSEDALADFLASTNGTLRPVGSGHSFSPLVPTDGYLVVLDQLTGLLAHDSTDREATFAAGTRLGTMGPALAMIDQAMPNLPDIDRQTLAGALATATHGAGQAFACLSGYVTELRLVTPNGDVHDLSRSRNAEWFDAARVSLGALGIITRVKLANVAPFRLKQRSWFAPLDEVLDQFDTLAARHRHFELFPLTHSDYTIALATDETREPVRNPIASPEEDAAFDDAMRHWMTLAPAERRPLINAMAAQIEPSERIDESYKILANVRNNRFNEMEYALPLRAGSDCLREILQTVRDRAIDVVFPLEYRYVSRDDTWLSMSSGDEDHVAISIHRIASEDYRPYFNAIEPIFWKYGGRPHWGKVHSLGAPQLTRLYPRFADFQALRQSLDPAGRLLNPHLRKVFGVTT